MPAGAPARGPAVIASTPAQRITGSTTAGWRTMPAISPARRPAAPTAARCSTSRIRGREVKPAQAMGGLGHLGARHLADALALGARLLARADSDSQRGHRRLL